MMKKLISILLSLAIAFSLVACGGSSEDNSTPESNSSEVTQTKNRFENDDLIREMPAPAEEFAGGDGSKENPFQISTAEELYRFAYVLNPSNIDLYDEDFAVEFRRLHYVLTDDIVVNDVSDFDNWLQDAPENGWEPYNAGFLGEFDGDGHTITGLYCYSYRDGHSTPVGFFASLYNGATVKNLNLDKCMFIAPGGDAGSITASATGATIENCTVNGAVLSHITAGGITGSLNNSVVQNCKFDGNVEGGGSGTGGISGYTSGSIIEKCTVLGKVVGAYSAGGITASFGNFSGIDKDLPAEAADVWAQLMDKGVGIRDCTNNAEVCGQGGEAGGIVAGISSSVLGVLSDNLNHYEYWDVAEISGCTNNGKITGVDGIAGAAGGICASLSTDVIKQDEKEITESWIITDCHNTGEITSAEKTDLCLNIGGILGGVRMKKGSLTISDCTNSGQVKLLDDAKDGNIGGIVGYFISDDGGSLIMDNLENTVDLVATTNSTAGGILGGAIVLKIQEKDCKLKFTDCTNTGNVATADSTGKAGGIFGNFLQGVSKDSWQGELIIENCVCNEGIPVVGAAGSIYDYAVKLIEAVEKEQNK